LVVFFLLTLWHNTFSLHHAVLQIL
jgi:hypothetical protein